MYSQECLTNSNGQFKNYLLSHNDEIINFACVQHYENPRIVYFAGAATLPDKQCSGAYTEILNHRAIAAKNAGAKYAFLHAMQDTSSPICQKRGFEVYGEFILYARH